MSFVIIHSNVRFKGHVVVEEREKVGNLILEARTKEEEGWEIVLEDCAGKTSGKWTFIYGFLVRLRALHSVWKSLKMSSFDDLML